jgi:hypothetical protein
MMDSASVVLLLTEDVDSMFLRNTGNHLQNHMLLNPEDCNSHLNHCENFVSHEVCLFYVETGEFNVEGM